MSECRCAAPGFLSQIVGSTIDAELTRLASSAWPGALLHGRCLIKKPFSNRRDMPALKAGSFKLYGRGSAAAVRPADGCGAIGRATQYFIKTQLPLKVIGQPHDHHAEVHQCRNEREDRGFLAAMLGGGRGKRRADFADELSSRPQAAGLIEKAAHLAGDAAKAGGRSEDDGVVVGQLVDLRDWSSLIELETRCPGSLDRHQL